MSLKRAAVIAATCILTIIVIMMIIGGCQEKPKVDPYAHITADSVTSNCTSPEEMHPVTRMGYPMDALVVRHKDCLGVKDMFFVIWPGENTETKRAGAKLLMLLYLEFQNIQNPKEIIKADLIKIDQVDTGRDESYMVIYSLNTTNLDEKKEETSEEVKL